MRAKYQGFSRYSKWCSHCLLGAANCPDRIKSRWTPTKLLIACAQVGLTRPLYTTVPCTGIPCNWRKEKNWPVAWYNIQFDLTIGCPKPFKTTMTVTEAQLKTCRYQQGTVLPMICGRLPCQIKHEEDSVTSTKVFQAELPVPRFTSGSQHVCGQSSCPSRTCSAPCCDTFQARGDGRCLR